MSVDHALFRKHLPVFPIVPMHQRGKGSLDLRYENVTQDGRLAALTLSHAIGAALWRDVLERDPALPTMAAQGILPILTRLAVVTGGGPIAVRAPIHAEGGFELVRTLDAEGRTRYRVDLFADATGTYGTVWGTPHARAGEPVALGSVWAEHILTKPFAPPAERTVTELPLGMVHSRDVSHFVPKSLFSTKVDWLAEWQFDVAPIVFGLGHTDSNQHVNSLVYPHLMEQAALRLLHAHGLKDVSFVARFEMAYRKPSFAGDELRLRLRLRKTSEGNARVESIFEDPEGDERVFGSMDLVAGFPLGKSFAGFPLGKSSR